MLAKADQRFIKVILKQYSFPPNFHIDDRTHQVVLTVHSSLEGGVHGSGL